MQIRVKTEGNNPISNFFLKKDVKREQALNITEERSSFNESVKTNWPEDMKEEPEPMKEIKEEESSVGEKWPSDKTDRTILPKGVKEEPGTADDIRSQSSEEKGDHDAKSITSILPNEKTTKQLHKRDYEEFLADSNPATDKTDKLGTSPLKRKGNLKDAGDKQPTLFSYFSKK